MKYAYCLLVFFLTSALSAQEAIPFKKEVAEIVKRNDSLWNSSQKTTVFTGSSSIRFWKDLQQRFPNQQVLNAGFGGSQATDLLYHLDDLVLRYKPAKVFIYEGDNDVFAKKRPKAILGTIEEIVGVLFKDDPKRDIVLLSVKPSLSRWHLKGKYKRLNKKLAKLATSDDRLAFLDVWTPMLNGRKVMDDIFVEDRLHMNKKGYDIWYNATKPFME